MVMKKKWMVLMTLTMSLTAASAAWAGVFDNYVDYQNPDGTYSYYFDQGVLVTLDENWYQNTIVKTSDRGATFYQKASYDAYEKEGMEGGRLFTIGASVNSSFSELPSFEYIGFDEDSCMNYYAELPTDYQAYMGDASIQAEYDALWSQVKDVIAGIRIGSEIHAGNETVDVDGNGLGEDLTSTDSGEWEYCLNEDGSVTISCWNGEAESLAIPGELGGRKVSVIGDKAFNACTGLKEVIIPDSVTQIGGGAFYECSGLVSVSIPDSVTQIEDYAFCLCTSLKDMSIPDSVTRIGKMAFTASDLQGVTIPASVEEIGNWAFGTCLSLTDIEVSPENESYMVLDHALVETKTKTLICYPCGLTDPEYEIPEGITRIGTNAFSFCDNLEHIIIPEGVTEIGEHAFSDCRFLTDISIPQSVERIGDLGFCNCKRLTDLTIPGSVTEIGRDAFYMCRDLTLTVPEGSYAEQYAKENEIPYKQ